MNQSRLKELLAAFAIENPHRPLSEVTVVEFVEWHETFLKWERVMGAAKARDEKPWREPAEDCAWGNPR